ncbi:MAG: hypothetical protein JST22_17780 [Bacteroidetes bacterium]|nr:hypothetical protein [Bacteroidota bacterium]
MFKPVRHVIFQLIVLVLATAAAGAQVRIVTRDSVLVSGEIMAEGGDSVAVRRSDGTIVVIRKKTIAALDVVADGDTLPPVPRQAPGSHSYRSFASIGGGLGFPGMINLVAGYTYGGWGVRAVLGGIPGSHHGYELDIVETFLMARTCQFSAYAGIASSTVAGAVPDGSSTVVFGVQLAVYGWYVTYADFASLQGSVRVSSVWAHVGIGYTHQFW